MHRSAGAGSGGDIARLAEAVEAVGPQALTSATGEFAFVAWYPRRHEVIVARDALGIMPLFYGSHGDLFVAASHGSLVAALAAGHDLVSLDYVSQYFAGVAPIEQSVFPAARALQSGCCLHVTPQRQCITRYWSVDGIPIDRTISRSGASAGFLELFRNAVAWSLRGPGPNWSELSGGLDTSSIVATTHLVDAGRDVSKLAGTVTYSDSFGAGDEREFVRLVLQDTGLVNEDLDDHWPWQDGDEPPIRTEIPGPASVYWTLERRRDRLLRTAGARAMLSGFGGDHLLDGNLFFLADWARRGQVFRALETALTWAAIRQESFWRYSIANIVRPLLPGMPRAASVLLPKSPSWLGRVFARRVGEAKHGTPSSAQVRVTDEYPRYRCEERRVMDCFGRLLPRPAPETSYERRYPFLHRPLVEFALSLPPELKVRPRVTKYVLREAMKGILPEGVRTRVGKGSAGSRMLWSLNHECAKLDGMLADPILGQLGVVDPQRLREAFNEVRAGKVQVTVPLFKALALETWLRIESGQWPARKRQQRANAGRTSTQQGDRQ